MAVLRDAKHADTFVTVGLNHAQLNLVGFGGNAGNYLAGC